MSVRELGVGVIYSPGLEPLLESRPDLVTVLEVEPQTLWRYRPAHDAPFETDRAELERISRLPQCMLVHGVGFPVGGSRPTDERHLGPLVETISCLRSEWASEHLGFNSFGAPEGSVNTGFLLPLLQTRAGVEAAVASVTGLAERLPVGLSIETGVNYLQPADGQLSDGAFVAAVAEQANCGILLDLHNLWANERNGRQAVKDFVTELPLDRVNEIHIAGGLEHRGYWLDAHSGRVPEPLLQLAEWVVPQLPNLGALIFELLPQFIEPLGLDGIAEELEKLHRLWGHRDGGTRSVRAPRAEPTPQTDHGSANSPAEWEAALGALVIGREPGTPLAAELAVDPGLALLRELVENFRAGSIVAVLRLTSRLLMLGCGKHFMQNLLSGFFATTPPALFASAEAEAFAAYVRRHALGAVPHLDEVLSYECASLHALLDGEARLIHFDHDPDAILGPLIACRLPEGPAPGDYEVAVQPDGDAMAAARGRVLTST